MSAMERSHAQASAPRVRASGPGDRARAGEAALLIARAAGDFDVARRSAADLEEPIAAGRAVLALLERPGAPGELAGFGYWSAWEGGRFVAHSGLVVDPAWRGRGLGRALKLALLASSTAAHPRARVMSLTSSPAVRALNESLGFRSAELAELTGDAGFWRGCEGCRNVAAVRAQGGRCCCLAMLLIPEGA